MNNLITTYDNLWNQSIKHFQTNQFDLDAMIYSGDDKRRGITLLSRTSSKISKTFKTFLDLVELIEPNQYYYPVSDFHLTIISIITCYNGFLITDICPKDYISVIDECIQKIKRFKISFKGITASPSCIMIQGFPLDNQLDVLRENLRRSFKKTALKNSIDARYTIKTAHSTVIRFQKPVINASKFLDLLDAYRHYDFGELEVDCLELVFNDWYQKKTNTKILHQIKLK